MRRLPLVSTVVAVVSGLVVLYLFFFSTPETEALRAQLLQLAASMGALALLIGIINLVRVHLGKVRRRDQKPVQSLVLLLGLFTTFIIALLFGPNFSVGEGEAAFQPVNWLFQYVQTPVEISLMALLSVSLLYAAARLLRRKANTFTLVFLLSFVFALLGTSLLGTGGFGFVSTFLNDFSAWFAQVPAAAGARGIIIGVALGAIATGIRILMGADRPYGGQ